MTEIEVLRNALIEIRDHWANQYDNPRKDNEMYRGSYGIGVTDGHRACAIIAEKALALPSQTNPHDPRGVISEGPKVPDSEMPGRGPRGTSMVPSQHQNTGE